MNPLRILVLGAHPDDPDIKAGGTCAKWCALGHQVRLVSLTDGSAGHHRQHGPALAARRRAEAHAAGAILGARYDVLNHPDGELLPTLEARRDIIRLIRSFAPDLLFTHRPNDYHPDHRYTATLVQDAAYMVTVPAICPDTPHLRHNPVILYLSDDFRRPAPFRPDVVVDIGPEMDRVIDMLHCHVSQFYEWLPANGLMPADVPADDAARRTWLASCFRGHLRPLADRYREEVVRTYGPERGGRVEYIEAFEVSEYGAPLDGDARARLFPFLPAPAPPTGAEPEWDDVRADE